MFETINAVQIHISLDEIEPAVWRRLFLPSAWNLGQLHLAIQAAFNWWNRPPAAKLRWTADGRCDAGV